MSLESILRSRNLGRILRIDLIRITDITDDSLDNFSFNEKLSIYFTPGTAGYRETHKRNANGTLWNNVLKFSVPKIREELLTWIQDNIDYYFVVIIQDANFTTRKVGSIDNPLQLAVDIETPTSTTARPQADYELKNFAFVPAPVFDYPWTTPTPEPDTIVTNGLIVVWKTYNIALTAGVAFNLVHNQNSSNWQASFKSSGLVQAIRMEQIDSNTIELYSQVDVSGQLDIIFKRQLN